jgi:hypothetical protein
MDEESLLFSQALRLYCVMDTSARLHLRYRQFLQQTFSGDSILQVIPLKAITFMVDYATGNHRDPRLSALVPALGMIFTNLYSPTVSADIVVDVEKVLKPLCSILATRARNIFEDLCIRRKVVVQPMQPSRDNDEQVEKTGSYYGRNPYRLRPFYEGKDVDKIGSVKDEGACRKLYSTYSKSNLTGGLMAFWCPHLVCLGFHAIPACEGRDDVFSAMLCYWDVAPEVIIYDFACQLAPYCLAREPEFFRDTLFVIDEMHANGHSSCSQAFFISNYMQTRGSLKPVNSSAAECSNSGLNRIRKSVSYMSEGHAALFTFVYMSIWNRRKEIALKKDAEHRLHQLNRNMLNITLTS